MGEVLGPWKKVKEQRDQNEETVQSTGVNGPIVSYSMPLEEIWAKYGKPGDLNGYSMGSGGQSDEPTRDGTKET